jgi:hypothetical protein
VTALLQRPSLAGLHSFAVVFSRPFSFSGSRAPFVLAALRVQGEPYEQRKRTCQTLSCPGCG